MAPSLSVKLDPCVAGSLQSSFSAVSVALAAQQPTFRSGTQTVPLYITVTDAAGRLVRT